MVELAKIFSQLKSFKALVLGDFMLDAYTTGKVKRISPEAPVPIMEVISQEERAGGAGNVVLNLMALGASVVSVGRIGKDAAGKRLQNQLPNAELIEQPNYPTPIKTRLIADSQQLMRIDHETNLPLPQDLEAKLIKRLEKLIPKVEIVAISDYGKGFLTPRLLQETIRICKKHKIPCLVDPKGIDFTKYKGATLIKPNLSEAYAAAKKTVDTDLALVARELLEYCDTLLITRSEAGISLFDAKGRSDFPVRFKEVKDVTGAGDTVLAVICLAVANGLDLGIASQLANIAAGLAIERLGCVQITLHEIGSRLVEYINNTKVLNESHDIILKNRNYNLLALPKGQQMTSALFKTLSDLSKEGELIVFAPNNEELIPILSSLREVSYILLEKKKLKPKKSYTFENALLRELLQVEKVAGVF